MGRISYRRPQQIVNLKVLGRLEVGGGQIMVPKGTSYFVDPTNGSAQFDGRSWDSPLLTLAAALALAVANDTIHLAKGAYAEAVTIARAQAGLTIICPGGRGSAFLEAPTDSTGLTNLANDVTLINVGLGGNGTGSGLINYGDRLRCYGCKIEGGTNGAVMTLGTVAQVAALTHGKGADCLFEDCEFAWSSAAGIKITASDYGAVTQLFVRRSKFHNLSAAHFEESGGSASIRFRNLEISDCVFDDDEGGAAPTKFISLNDDNGNDGIVSGCRFPTALNGGLNLVSTALTWVGNLHPAGLSTTQPS